MFISSCERRVVCVKVVWKIGIQGYCCQSAVAVLPDRPITRMGRLRCGPFTPYWRVALRSIGAWPRRLGAQASCDWLIAICAQPITRTMRGSQDPRASLRKKSWIITRKKICRGSFLRHSVRKNNKSELSHVDSHTIRPRLRRRAPL